MKIIKVKFKITEDCDGKLYLEEKIVSPFWKRSWFYIYVDSSYKLEEIYQKINERIISFRKELLRKTLLIQTYLISNNEQELIKEEDE